MVNASLNWASIVGIVLAVGGAMLYFMRSFKPALARDYDVFFAAISQQTQLRIDYVYIQPIYGSGFQALSIVPDMQCRFEECVFVQENLPCQQNLPMPYTAADCCEFQGYWCSSCANGHFVGVAWNPRGRYILDRDDGRTALALSLIGRKDTDVDANGVLIKCQNGLGAVHQVLKKKYGCERGLSSWRFLRGSGITILQLKHQLR